jgi:hypothetical protein
MARQRALNEWILGNANLWAGQRSLIVGHLRKPFSRQIKDGRRNMEQTVYNPQKGRLETINIEFTDENTTWFDDHEKIEEIYMVTDFEGGLIIGGLNYNYPILVYDISRSDINDDIKKVLDLQKRYTETQETI